MMKTQRGYGVVALVIGVTALTTASAAADTLLHARISYDAGGTMVKGAEDADWSFATVNTLILPHDTLWVDKGGTMELEMAGGSFLRMADGSKAEIAALPPLANVRGWTGAFYVQRIRRSTGNFAFETPACAVQVEPDSQVRIDIVGEGATTVSVRWGRATVRAQTGPSVVVTEGRRVYVDPGCLPSSTVPFDRSLEDSFDAWNRERARTLALGPGAVPTTVRREVIGVTDLAPYGEWVVVSGAHYWRPTVVVNFVPYRCGHWSYVPACGYVWVGDYPFSYVTSHYGRWRYDTGYGWMWCYHDAWRPAAVATIRCGPNLVWCPLDPWDRPVIVSGAYYTVGNVHIGLYASSYCPIERVLVGPGVVYACTPHVITHVPASQINIWNINITGGGWASRVTTGASPMEVRNYFPRRSIRGPSTSGGSSPRSASARIITLEKTDGRARFASGSVRGRSDIRTAIGKSERTAQLRSVSTSSPRRVTRTTTPRTGTSTRVTRTTTPSKAPGVTVSRPTTRTRVSSSPRPSVRSTTRVRPAPSKQTTTTRSRSYRVVTPAPAPRPSTSSSRVVTTRPRTSVSASPRVTRAPEKSYATVTRPSRSTRTVVTPTPRSSSSASSRTTRVVSPSPSPSPSTSTKRIVRPPSPSPSSRSISSGPSSRRTVSRPSTSSRSSASVSRSRRSVPSASKSSRGSTSSRSVSRRSR